MLLQGRAGQGRALETAGGGLPADRGSVLPGTAGAPRPCTHSRPRRSGWDAPAQPERRGIRAGAAGARAGPELEPKLEPALRRTERSAAAKPSKGRGTRGGPQTGVPAAYAHDWGRAGRRGTRSRAEPQRARN